jgi:hypothetical protein
LYSAEAASALMRQVGLSLRDYAALALALRLLCALVWFLVAGVLVWRRPDDRFIYISALQLVVNGSGHPNFALQSSSYSWQHGALLVNTLYMVLLVLVLTLFPDGRFVPRWMGWIVLVATVLMVTPLGASVFFIFIALGLASQGYRYARASHPV